MGPSRLDHRVEAPPPGLRQPHPVHPCRARPNPLERHGCLLRHREAPIHDPHCSHGRQHPRQQQTSSLSNQGHLQIHQEWSHHPQGTSGVHPKVLLMQGVTGQPMGLPATPVILGFFFFFFLIDFFFLKE
jgi:hypothetical protein